MTEFIPTPQGAPPPVSGSSLGAQASRLVRMFSQPGAALRELHATPSWLVALVAIVVVALAAQLVIAPRIDWEGTVRQTMQDRRGGQIPEQQMDRAIEGATKFGRVMLFVSPLLAPVMFLLLAGLYFLGLKALGSATEYKPVFATLLHAVFPPQLVSSVLLAVVASRRGSFIAQDLETMLKSSVAGWLPTETAKPIMAIAGVLDIFNLWQWILLVLGFQIVGRVSRSKAVALVVVTWGVWALGKAGLAALQ